MPGTDGPTIDSAINALLEVLNNQVKTLRDRGGKSLTTGNYETAGEAMTKAKKWESIRDKVQQIKQDIGAVKHGSVKTRTTRKQVSKKLAKSSEDLPTLNKFQEAILKALESMGGSAPSERVSQRVEKILAGKLDETDKELLSRTGRPRWTQSVINARNALVKAGFLKSTSDKGIWELSETGLRFALNLNVGSQGLKIVRER